MITPRATNTPLDIAWLRMAVHGHLQQRFPDVPQDTALTVDQCAAASAHPTFVIRPVSFPDVRFLLKWPPDAALEAQSLTTEVRLLSELTPRIMAANPALRCPELVAHHPNTSALLTEFVDGVSLHRLLGDWSRWPSRNVLRRSLHLAGEWLARFHTLTANREAAPNPLRSLQSLIARPGIHRLFTRHLSAETHTATRKLIDSCERQFAAETVACMIHGEFVPYHILVREDAIYVIDLASARPGFPHEDLAMFTSWSDLLLPWRLLSARLHMEPAAQRDTFLAGYYAHAPLRSEVDDVLIRVGRLAAIIRFALWISVRDTWKHAVYQRIAGPWLGCRLPGLFHRDLEALQRMLGKPRTTNSSPPPPTSRPERCPRRAAVTAAGVVEKNYSHAAATYDATRHLSRKARFTAACETAVLRNAIATRGPRLSTLLDIACGTGHFTLQLADLFERVVAVDLTREMLGHLQEKRAAQNVENVWPVHASVNGLPIRAGVAEVVLATRFLHLFPRSSHRAVLTTMLDLLRPGGILIVDHDSPLLEWFAWLVGRLRGRRKDAWVSYHASEMPSGSRRLVRLGVSAPGLPTLALVFPRLARQLARAFVRRPLNACSTFVIVIYEKFAVDRGPSQLVA
jgi:ubiquinone/menaquinone biosynthesis C-methylase UbiE/Ser/Thr protein kinase RdoA (MazF antagonist)